jgi:adenylate cyclase
MSPGLSTEWCVGKPTDSPRGSDSHQYAVHDAVNSARVCWKRLILGGSGYSRPRIGGAWMTAAGLACISCGTELREGAKFCDECGAAVSAAAEPAEYKQVTVLFADVVHSMDIAAAVGAERLREIMTALVNRASQVVQRYGGTADKFTGDGIMALFGAPTALEDHAFRACLSALAIQEEAKALAGEVQRRDGVELQLRIGLNSGEVIAGQLGSRSRLG